MRPEQVFFLRIDTAEGAPALQEASGEAVVSALLAGANKGWFDLVAFVVLPKELQLMVIPRGKAVRDLLINLEEDIHLTCHDVDICFDKDFYHEKVDVGVELQQRLRWLLSAPVRCRLAKSSDSYPLSSANQRFRDAVKTSQVIN